MEASMEMVQPDFLRPVEASVALKISRSKLYEAMQRGEIPFVRIAGLMRIPRRWVEERIGEAMAGASSEDREGAK
jgi:excisionase family DNA binding protein